MPQTQTVDVTQIIDGQKFRAFNLGVVVWCFLLVFVDGYDFSAAPFAAPALIKAWHITNVAVLGPIFSASIFGILFGAPLLGYVADRMGRRFALVLGGLICGLMTFAAAFSPGIPSFMVLRFLSGLGLGGVMPIAIALNAEFAPKRLRAKLVCIMFSGLSFGVGVPGAVAAWLVPVYGWQVIFLIGGIVPTALALALAFALPESPKFLALRPHRRAELARLLARMQPGFTLQPEAQVILSGEAVKSRPSVKDLFRDRYARITPILWILFIANGFVQYAIQAWTPTLLAMAGLPVSHAAIATSIYQIGAAVGGLVVGWPVDRFGWRPLTVMLLLAIPVVACIGLPGLPEPLLMILLLGAGFLVIGTQFGMNALAGMIYPSYIRANGVGWALGIARLGFIFGATIVGYLAAQKLPLQDLFFLAAAPLIIGVVCCYLLIRLHPAERSGEMVGPRGSGAAVHVK